MMFEQANFIELLQVHEHHQFTTNSQKIAEREICEPMTSALDLEKNEKFSCATSRERELTCPPSSLSDAERDRAAEIRGWRPRSGGRDSRARGGAATGAWRRRGDRRLTLDDEEATTDRGPRSERGGGESRPRSDRGVESQGQEGETRDYFGNAAPGSRFEKPQSTCIKAAHERAFPAIQQKKKSKHLGGILRF
jgi:hypothetical protein